MDSAIQEFCCSKELISTGRATPAGGVLLRKYLILVLGTGRLWSGSVWHFRASQRIKRCEVALLLLVFTFGSPNPRTQAYAPMYSIFSLGDVRTSLPNYLAAGTVEPGAAVFLNDAAVAVDANGAFSYPVSLHVGNNELKFDIHSSGGQYSYNKNVIRDPLFAVNRHDRLLVDAVLGDSTFGVDGTIVIDLQQQAVIGLLPNQHIRGVSSGRTELYTSTGAVLSSANFGVLRQLPFTQEIPRNGFLVSPRGTQLYSRDEIVNVASNTLVGHLPFNVTTGSSWSAARIPGGPTISPDGTFVCGTNSVRCFNVDSGQILEPQLPASFVSDLEFSLDGQRLLRSMYAYGSTSVEVYDFPSFELSGTINGLPDFAGELGFLSKNIGVVAYSGNPTLLGGGLTTFSVDSATVLSPVSAKLSDNLTVAGNRVFAANSSIDPLGDKRFGVNAWRSNSEGTLVLESTFFLGINEFQNSSSSGRPIFDQIDGIEFLAASVPVLPGDYNGNGKVEGADYVLWRKTLGQTGTKLAADGNDNGVVYDGDFQLWRANFGIASASAAAVPEPSALTLVIGTAFLICWVALNSRRVPRTMRFAAVVVASLTVNETSVEAEILLDDNFTAGFNQQKWFVKAWDNSTYIDGTQLRVYPYQPLVHDGFLDLIFSAYNPTAGTPGDSFYGSQIISQQEFGPTASQAIRFTSRARFLPPVGQSSVPSGIVGSMFPYKLLTANSRNEIDVEVLTKPQGEGPGFLSNVFVNDPFTVAGDVQFLPDTNYNFRDFHEYSVLWSVDSITWYLDGKVVRREIEMIPTGSLQLYFNVWAPRFGGFARAIDTSLQPATSAGANKDVIWQLDSARVETVRPILLGDYNNDGKVDTLDYVVWRKTKGQVGSSLAADGSGNGLIDDADYGIWRANVGKTASAASAFSEAIAEPASGALVLAALLATCARSHRARRRIWRKRASKLQPIGFSQALTEEANRLAAHRRHR